MAEEKSRTRSVRRITAPGDTGTYIDLKIIDDITFKEEKPPYQEWVLKFQNNPDDAARTVRVVEVGDAKLKVERIDTLDTEESTGRRQESIWSFLNDKDPPVHLETHETTIYASDGNGNITDTGTWIKVQRIDKIEFEDEADEVRNQESVWQLDNPDKSDDKDDYKELTPPVQTWDNSTINPPWRLDPFQTITDCSFGRYMLVLYGSNKIAAVKISDAGAFTVPVKKTLTESSWGSASWDGWTSGNVFPKPTFFLPLAQMKISNTLHVMSCSMKIIDGVISMPENMEQRPLYNVADTIHKFAESSTPLTDYLGISAYTFGPSIPPALNGTGNVIYNENNDKFEWSQTGIKKLSSGSSAFPSGFQSAAASWGWIASVDTSGGRYTPVYVFNNVSVNEFVQPFSYEQQTAYTNWYTSFPYAEDIPVYLYFYGPDNNGFTGAYAARFSRFGAESGSTSLTARISVYKKSSGLDQIISTPVTVTESYTYDDNTLYRWDIDYAGVQITTQSLNGPWYDVSMISFPYAIGTETSKMFYKIEEIISPNWRYEYHTPYETWTSPDVNFSDFTGSFYNRFDPFYSGWLQVSDGNHLIQGYIKNAKRRLFMDGVEKGTALAAAIGCDLEDIVTVMLGVKLSDIQNLK